MHQPKGEDSCDKSSANTTMSGIGSTVFCFCFLFRISASSGPDGPRRCKAAKAAKQAKQEAASAARSKKEQGQGQDYHRLPTSNKTEDRPSKAKEQGGPGGPRPAGRLRTANAFIGHILQV
jgi:hypothetical protein